MNNNAALDEIRRVLLENDDFVITAHVNPDSDAVGSCLALGLSLKKLGKRVNVILDAFHSKNLIIPGQGLIWEGAAAAPDVSALITLDCANAERVYDPFALMKLAPVTICIDHHLSHDPFARYIYLDPDASSTCELIYRIVSAMVEFDADIGSAIYAGLLTDTGGFRHRCVSSETLRVASELIKLNIPFTDIYNELLKKHSPVETYVMRAALNNLELLQNGRAALSFISSEDMTDIGATASDTDGISEYLLNIRDVEAAVFLYEKSKGEVKASIRSLTINVSETAKAFGGGGHKRAAGCIIRSPLAEACGAMSRAIISAIETA
jgi:phosphoesterase RecJ-like protein